MSYYLESDSHARDKVKLVLELSSYATKKGFHLAKSVDTSDLAAKKDFIALKAEVEKLDINNVQNSLNNLKTKVDNLAVGKLKTVPADSKNLKDLVNNEIVKNTNVNALKTKVSNLGKKILSATSLIHINQYPTKKFRENWNMLIRNTRYKWFRDYNCFEYKN